MATRFGHNDLCHLSIRGHLHLDHRFALPFTQDGDTRIAHVPHDFRLHRFPISIEHRRLDGLNHRRRDHRGCNRGRSCRRRRAGPHRQGRSWCRSGRDLRFRSLNRHRLDRRWLCHHRLLDLDRLRRRRRNIRSRLRRGRNRPHYPRLATDLRDLLGRRFNLRDRPLDLDRL